MSEKLLQWYNYYNDQNKKPADVHLWTSVLRCCCSLKGGHLFLPRYLSLRALVLRRGAAFWTCRARVPNPRHCRDSVTKRCVGDTHSTTSSLASPPGGRDTHLLLETERSNVYFSDFGFGHSLKAYVRVLVCERVSVSVCGTSPIASWRRWVSLLFL